MTDLLVLHDAGAPGGGEWADAFADWPGRVLTPDLPGHNGTPPPVGGHHETGDAVYAALAELRPDPPDELLVVGIGRGGAAAQILALGGRAVGLVLVDGLGGPWLDDDQLDRRQIEMQRRILATPEALALPAPGADDPRATLVVPPGDRGFAERQADAMPVAALVIETPASRCPDAADLVARMSDGELRSQPDRAPAAIAAVVTAWWAERN